MSRLELRVLGCCCCLLIGGLITGHGAQVSAWQLPTPEQVQLSLESCRSDAEATTLLCLVEQLGLWTDEHGYQAKRIAKIFAARRQMEELTLVIDYCNRRERREREPAQWAYAAYKCATAGRFGHWVKEYMNQQQSIK